MMMTKTTTTATTTTTSLMSNLSYLDEGHAIDDGVEDTGDDHGRDDKAHEQVTAYSPQHDFRVAFVMWRLPATHKKFGDLY
jgi:hypothetical protein